MPDRRHVASHRKAAVRAARPTHVRTGCGAIGVLLVVAAAWLHGFAQEAQPVSAIVSSSTARASYLARATIWKDPGALTPQDILKGPPSPPGFDPSDVFTCSFAQP